MKKISFLFISFFVLLLSSCDNEDVSVVAPHVSFENDRVFGIAPDEVSSTQDIKVYANTVSGVDRVFNIVVVQNLTTVVVGSYTVPAIVTIPANSREATFAVTIDNNNLGSGKVLALDFGPNSDGTFDGAPLLLTARVVCPFNEVNFRLVLDRWGSETTWQITKGAEVIASGGPYTDTATNAAQPPLNFSYCLPAGNYVFTINDSFGDGITGPSGNGSYTITEVSTGNVLVTGGTFGSTSSHPFTLN